ncbi:Protein of unknown function [Pyronema omphalodes CBS 100304]|uniref:Uncharacterized protein n=1 Tax=Pyronema omphalodes (strain CBS 100304) TaxID=1076935 RepID=U4KWD9_PYROM|nr:Protein of unknown function [Pyronema omphalodes CBS 100304]
MVGSGFFGSFARTGTHFLVKAEEHSQLTTCHPPSRWVTSMPDAGKTPRPSEDVGIGTTRSDI